MLLLNVNAAAAGLFSEHFCGYNILECVWSQDDSTMLKMTSIVMQIGISALFFTFSHWLLWIVTLRECFSTFVLIYFVVWGKLHVKRSETLYHITTCKTHTSKLISVRFQLHTKQKKTVILVEKWIFPVYFLLLSFFLSLTFTIHLCQPHSVCTVLYISVFLFLVLAMRTNRRQEQDVCLFHTQNIYSYSRLRKI